MEFHGTFKCYLEGWIFGASLATNGHPVKLLNRQSEKWSKKAFEISYQTQLLRQVSAELVDHKFWPLEHFLRQRHVEHESFLVLYAFLRPNIWNGRVIQQSPYSEYRIVNKELGDLKSLNFKVVRRAKGNQIESKAFTFTVTFSYRVSLPSTTYNLLRVSSVKFYFLHLLTCICLYGQITKLNLYWDL